MTATDNHNERLQAVGTTLSVTPPMRDLYLDAQEMLDSGMSETEVHARLCELAFESDIGARAFFGLNRSVSRLPADKAIITLVTNWLEKQKKQTLQNLLSDWLRKNGGGTWIADYVLEWATTGNPPALKESSVQWTGVINVGPKGDQIPLVVAVASPLSDPDLLAEQLRQRCHDEFPDEIWAEKREQRRDSERFRLFNDGHKDLEIARMELDAEGRLIACVDKREEQRELEARANSILKSRSRWSKHVTKLLGLVSPDSE